DVCPRPPAKSHAGQCTEGAVRLHHLKRHVKCDETKPACNRCIKWQGFCDGYSNRAQIKIEKGDDVVSKPKAPKSKPISAAANSIALAKPLGMRIQPGMPGSVFAHECEKKYFDTWLGLAENIGGGWFDANLLSRTIPQLSHEDTAVKYAAMAIGALASAQASRGPARLCDTPLMLDTKPHYKNALTYYGQAMHQLGRQASRTQAGKESYIRSAVIACLLFVCFETLHGNQSGAVQHIKHGLTIVQQFLERHKDAANGNEGAPADSPSPLVLEDEILQVFQRLEFQSWTTAIMARDRKGATLPFKVPENRTPEDIPPIFSDLEEARRWWDLVQHWVLFFHRTIADDWSTKRAEVAEVDPERAHWLDISDMPSTIELRPRYLAILERWYSSFLPLYARILADRITNQRPYYQALSLLLQFHISWISTRAGCFSEYATMYAMTPKFKEIVRLCRILLPMQQKVNGAEVFTMDNGPTMALFIASTKCRDPDVREQALALLHQYPRRDGFWDTRMTTTIAELNRIIEVENMSEGSLPDQWARLRQRSATLSDRAPEAYVRYYAMDKDTNQWVTREATVKY
ncbi:hypothetical protein GQ53DRAFT_659947, partial [Thozetella sp. PMI_491]